MSRSNTSSTDTKTLAAQPKIHREFLLLVSITGLAVLAWWVSSLGLYKPESDLGYALGVAGGTMMVLLFAYPLRKRVPFMQNWGKTRYWFWWHMMLGILGPSTILFHSGYYFGSLNATVAFSAMACVALSGVFGRFVYARIHHGLYGRRATLKEMQAALGGAANQGRTILAGLSSVEKQLQQFETQALQDRKALARAWYFVTLGFQMARVRRACFLDISHHLTSKADVRQAQESVRQYLEAVGRVARFRTFERLFALWHVLHVPLVWMLVLCAVAHVVAVHIY